MALSIVISMSTAVSVVKVMMLSLARRRRLKTIRIKPLFGFRPVPDGTQFRFMKTRLAALALTALLVLGSVAALFKRDRRHPGDAGDVGLHLGAL